MMMVALIVDCGHRIQKRTKKSIAGKCTRQLERWGIEIVQITSRLNINPIEPNLPSIKI